MVHLSSLNLTRFWIVKLVTPTMTPTLPRASAVGTGSSDERQRTNRSVLRDCMQLEQGAESVKVELQYRSEDTVGQNKAIHRLRGYLLLLSEFSVRNSFPIG